MSTPPPPPGQERRNGFGITALVLGVVGLLFSFIPIIGVIAWPLVILGLIFGGLGLNRALKGRADKGLPIAGLATSLVGLLICILYAVVFSQAASHYAENPPHEFTEQAYFDQARSYGVRGSDAELREFGCALRGTGGDPGRIDELGADRGLSPPESGHVYGMAFALPCGG
ncbi:hypothetical protein [Saccharopolyspora sp. CA-218241]|uniref:hypothetical protein n=1 Tax=Saccharopolyspora sp. CA-218241 TaxID=3240027 RepID=UPI003D961287